MDDYDSYLDSLAGGRPLPLSASSIRRNLPRPSTRLAAFISAPDKPLALHNLPKSEPATASQRTIHTVIGLQRKLRMTGSDMDH
jgi:hypothetical protein